MIPLFTKPIRELNRADVQQLVDEAMPEGQTVDLKRELPANNRKGDKWLRDQSGVGDHARNKIFAEVISFANAEGGNLIIGVDEAGDAPPRASEICPLPACHDLAERLRLMARDCIEPQLPSINVIGIDCGEDNDGTGVVLIRVPPSRLAPHRLIPTKDCYIRRADRTEKMTMAEIQASTLQSVNRHAEIKERLEARRKAHIHLVEVGGAIGRCRLGVRLTTLPIGAPVQLNRVYGNAEIFGMIRDFNILIDGKPGAINAPGSMRNINDFGVRPIFGGGRRSSDGQNNLWLTQEIHNDGMTELLFDVHDSEDNVLPLTNLLGILCNSLAVADRVRKAAGLPANEFLIDIEAMSAVIAPKLLDLPERQYLGVGDREQGLLNPNPLRLPRYTVGEPSGFENIVITVMNDFREAAGLRAVDGLTVDFE